jgi:acetyl-CoA acyltransferase
LSAKFVSLREVRKEKPNRYLHFRCSLFVPPAVTDAYICDAIRTPFGKYGGALSSIRADDLAALPIKALMERNSKVDWGALDDVIYGCANQAGEDNRNVARMALLLSGLPKNVPGATVNRLCGSSLEAV